MSFVKWRAAKAASTELLERQGLVLKLVRLVERRGRLDGCLEMRDRHSYAWAGDPLLRRTSSKKCKMAQSRRSPVSQAFGKGQSGLTATA